MFRYRLHPPDGDDLGEATYAQMIHADEEIIAGSNQHFRVLDVVSIDEEDESRFVPTGRGRVARTGRSALLRKLCLCGWCLNALVLCPVAHLPSSR
jgi:hypothetical protein